MYGSMAPTYDRRPAPVVPMQDQERVAETWALKTILDWKHRDLLREHTRRQLGWLRARLVGEVDIGSNLLSSSIDQTMSIYDDEPLRQRGDQVLIDLIRKGGWWTIASHHERYVRALRESLVFVGWDRDRDVPYYRLVTPDLITIDPDPENPTLPGTIWEASLRTVPGKTDRAWFWDQWTSTSFQIWTGDRRRDVTEQFGDPEEFARAADLKDDDGKPILRWALYHASGGGGRMFNWHRSAGIAFGTLQVGLLWTGAVHGFLRASWDTRVLLNAKVTGGAVEKAGNTPIRTIVPDPTGVLQVSGENAAIASWGAQIDIEKAEKFVRFTEARIAVSVGMSPADLIIESLNPASGASITVSQTGKRRLAKKEAPHFRAGDRQLAKVTAAVARLNGVLCSAKDWSAQYPGVELTIDERVKVTQYVKAELDMSVLDDIGAYQELHPGASREDAEADIEEQAARRQDLADLAAAKVSAGGVVGGGDVQSSILDGKQIDALAAILAAVKAGTQDPESAVEAIIFALRVSDQTARKMVKPSIPKEKPPVPPSQQGPPAPPLGDGAPTPGK